MVAVFEGSYKIIKVFFKRYEFAYLWSVMGRSEAVGVCLGLFFLCGRFEVVVAFPSSVLQEFFCAIYNASKVGGTGRYWDVF